MNQQQALQALLDGKKIRRNTWFPGDFITYWKQTWVPDDQTGIPIYEPKSGLLFYSKEKDGAEPLHEEEAAKLFDIDTPWEELIEIEGTLNDT